MQGYIDQQFRALIDLKLVIQNNQFMILPAWIDTAFDGALVCSQDIIKQLNLEASAEVAATLADGTSIILKTYSCKIEWLDTIIEVEVVANQGKLPLVGLELLKYCQLLIDYRTSQLTIN